MDTTDTNGKKYGVEALPLLYYITEAFLRKHERKNQKKGYETHKSSCLYVSV